MTSRFTFYFPYTDIIGLSRVYKGEFNFDFNPPYLAIDVKKEEEHTLLSISKKFILKPESGYLPTKDVIIPREKLSDFGGYVSYEIYDDKATLQVEITDY